MSPLAAWGYPVLAVAAWGLWALLLACWTRSWLVGLALGLWASLLVWGWTQ